VEFNINLAEIDGLEQTFGDYLSVNPDLSSAALTIDDRIAIHTDPSRVGLPWLVGENNYAYVVELTTPEDVRSVKVAVEMPHGVVVDQIVRSVKNFAALFIASAFLANLFFQVGGAVRQNPGREDRVAAAPEHHAQLVNYLNPVFFLAVLSEHLSYAFLPQFVRDIAAASGVPDGWTTAPFVIYYAVFALTLLPAGYVAQRTSPRPMMYLGLLVAAGSMFALSEAQDFWTVLAARAGAGLGQGLIFIGVQNYLLAVSSPNHKTQAAAVIVYGFQGGMISGMAVGSLLVGTMGRDGVFGLAAVIAAVAAVYTLMTVPVLSRAALAAMSSGSTSGLGRGVMLSLGDRHFMTAMLSIGMPAKAVLTGVVTFGLPLLLTSMMYPQEDIGQLIMIYALAVVISSRVIAPKVDRLGDSQSALFHGTILSGLGLMVMAASGLYEPALTAAYGGSAATVVLAVGIALVGVAHGFINAPVVTFVAGSRLASRIGAGAATSTYRFLERIGHVAGPMIVAQLFVLFADDWSAIAAAGAGVLFLGMVFFMVCASARESRSPGVDPSPENTPV
jgi:predicted MFS family arabinose efflux permease